MASQDEQKGDYATLDIEELIECMARCAVNKYEMLMRTHSCRRTGAR